MKVGFYNTFRSGGDPRNLVLADVMIRSVRRHMPGIEVWQFSDETSPELYGIDGIRRLPSAPLTILTAQHYALCEGDWLLIDTDVIVQRDVRDVFEDESFDVAVTDREGTYVAGELGSEFIRTMPYNIGVVFSRSPAFWSDVVERLKAQPPKVQAWMGNQIVAAELISEGKYRTKILPGYVYNRPPRTATEDVSDASLVHYKGPTRKPWMFNRFYEGLCASA